MKRSNTKKKDKKKNKKQTRSSINLGKVSDKHVKSEFEDKDVDSMKIMVKEPYVNHVHVMTGGVGYKNVYNFYKNEFVGKMPKDFKITRISRTVGKNQVADEFIASFIHDIEIKAMLPGMQHTGKFVELPHVVVMKFRGNKIVHEHISQVS